MKRVTIVMMVDDVEALDVIASLLKGHGSLHMEIAEVRESTIPTLEAPPMRALAKHKQKRADKRVVKRDRLDVAKISEEVMTIATRLKTFKSKDIAQSAPVGLQKAYQNALYHLKRAGRINIVGGKKFSFVYAVPPATKEGPRSLSLDEMYENEQLEPDTE